MASKLSIVYMTLDHVFLQYQFSKFLKAPSWLKPHISRKPLFLVAANEGRDYQKGMMCCPTEESFPLTLMYFRHACL